MFLLKFGDVGSFKRSKNKKQVNTNSIYFVRLDYFQEFGIIPSNEDGLFVSKVYNNRDNHNPGDGGAIWACVS